MNIEQFTRDDERFVRRYEYDGRQVVAVDLGLAAADASIDVVGTSLIVVYDDEQLEFDLPTHDVEASINNGVLTIELEAEA